jgi:hypothetical protein
MSDPVLDFGPDLRVRIGEHGLAALASGRVGRVRAINGREWIAALEDDAARTSGAATKDGVR